MSDFATVPLFGLYGESSGSPEPGFVHIEDVASRSRALDWRIEAHRHAHLFQVLSIHDGFSEVRFDDTVCSLTNGAVIAIPPGVVHSFRFAPGTEGVVLTIADAVLREVDAGRHLAAFIGAPELIELDPESALFSQLKEHLRQIKREFERPGTGHALMLSSLVKIVLTLLVRHWEETHLRLSGNRSDSEMLRSFQELLEDNYADQWPVQRYAAALNTSVSSLNRRCLRYVGMTAKSIVQDRVLVEAKRKLIYTREPVEHIAFSLGFRDPAYFSRFFKKSEGLPPGEYRRTTGSLP